LRRFGRGVGAPRRVGVRIVLRTSKNSRHRGARAFCLLDPLWIGERARVPGSEYFWHHRGQQPEPANEKTPAKPVSPRRRGSRATRRRRPRLAFGIGRKFSSAGVTHLIRDLQNTRDFAELNFEGRASSLSGALRTAVEYWRGPAGCRRVCCSPTAMPPTSARIWPALDGCPPIFISGGHGQRFAHTGMSR